MTKRTVSSFQMTEADQRKFDALEAAGFGTRTNIIRTALDRMYREEIKTMTTYTNIDERYGEQVQATIADYQQLNPEGKFVEIHGQIRELLSDTPGDYEVIAIEQEIIDTQKERDQLLDDYSKTQ